ncbi:MAG: hypothetical protein Ta2E_12780 [Mycoplasmoidaceae bacterium]|nr:MAG: hypothetical protein Ta2E_12780 [Mycoplasmoidaceae bacterium]
MIILTRRGWYREIERNLAKNIYKMLELCREGNTQSRNRLKFINDSVRERNYQGIQTLEDKCKERSEKKNNLINSYMTQEIKRNEKCLIIQPQDGW